MTNMRMEFSPEFKLEAIALLESSGQPLIQVATELGIWPSVQPNWRTVVHGGSARSRVATPSGLSPIPSPAD